MSRKISFDYTESLDQATWLFWQNGYGGTSLRELLKAMRIGEGSFYNTHKSKKQLYVECLSRYEETVDLKRWEAFKAAPTAGAGIRAMFDMIMDCLDDPQTPSRLCVWAAMLSHDVLSDPELRSIVETGLDRFRGRLVDRLNHDRERGLLPATLDAQGIASVITTYINGMWRMALVDYDRPRFAREIDIFVTSLGL